MYIKQQPFFIIEEPVKESYNDKLQWFTFVIVYNSNY